MNDFSSGLIPFFLCATVSNTHPSPFSKHNVLISKKACIFFHVVIFEAKGRDEICLVLQIIIATFVYFMCY